MPTDSIEELKGLVEMHTVHYEVWPHWDLADGEKRVMNGFDLELHGTHEHGHTRMTPGCDLCRKTYNDLKKIAEAILPREERPSQYEVSAFDNSLHGRPRGGMEVVLTVRIEHRRGYFDPIDACEERCLKEMESKLAELGARGGRGARAA